MKVHVIREGEHDGRKYILVATDFAQVEYNMHGRACFGCMFRLNDKSGCNKTRWKIQCSEPVYYAVAVESVEQHQADIIARQLLGETEKE